MMQVADGRALLENVGDDGTPGEQLRFDFLFLGIVRADCGDEGTGRDVITANETCTGTS